MRAGILLPMLFTCANLLCCSEPTMEPAKVTNLVTNPSFERGGSPSLEGWTLVNYDSAFVRFVTDVPPNGGSYSISADNFWAFRFSLQASFPISPGEHMYQFSAWSRIDAPLSWGEMSIRHKTADTTFDRKSIWFDDSVWTKQILADTIVGEQADTIVVSLHSDPSQWSSGSVFYDLVELIQTDGP